MPETKYQLTQAEDLKQGDRFCWDRDGGIKVVTKRNKYHVFSKWEAPGKYKNEEERRQTNNQIGTVLVVRTVTTLEEQAIGYRTAVLSKLNFKGEYEKYKAQFAEDVLCNPIYAIEAYAEQMVIAQECMTTFHHVVPGGFDRPLEELSNDQLLGVCLAVQEEVAETLLRGGMWDGRCTAQIVNTVAIYKATGLTRLLRSLESAIAILNTINEKIKE